ncbi:MAG: SCO family protein [Nitrospirae bacterium]|nr:SCO family protein [Nitrospirota bacterium]
MRHVKTFLLILLLFSVIGAAETRAGGAASGSAGLDERPGNYVPSDLVFHDENGNAVALKELMGQPVVLMLTYFGCSHICPQMLGSFAVALGSLPLEPGKDYRAITLSFDETDTPRDAQTLKANYLRAVNKPFPGDAWKFLTGDSDSLRRMCEAVGIKVKKANHGFVHPEVLIFLSPEGKITRYLHVSKYSYGVAYPIAFSELDLTSAFAEARRGKVTAATNRDPLYCFLHEPEQQKTFFTVLRLSGVITLALMLLLFVYLKTRKGSQERSTRSGR